MSCEGRCALSWALQSTACFQQEGGLRFSLPWPVVSAGLGLSLLSAQGATAREWLVGAGQPLSAAAFAPLLRRPGLELGRLTAGARRGGAFLGDASRWRWAAGRASGAPDPGDDAPDALRGGGAPAGGESGAAAAAERGADFRFGPDTRAAAVEGGRFDMDAPPLGPELRVECPLDFPRPGLAEVAAGAAKPYLFGGQRPGCTNCNDPHKARPAAPAAQSARGPRIDSREARWRGLHVAAPRCPATTRRPVCVQQCSAPRVSRLAPCGRPARCVSAPPCPGAKRPGLRRGRGAGARTTRSCRTPARPSALRPSRPRCSRTSPGAPAPATRGRPICYA